MTSYRFGKHAPKLDYRTLRFRDYVTSDLTPPPPSYSSLKRVYQSLKIDDPTKLFPMDGNDSLGDCTCAALAHAVTADRGLIGTERIMSKDDVIKLYEKLTGGPDTGLNELDVLKYWRKNEITGDKILAYVSIDPKNHKHIEQAIHLFGGVYLGFQVQKNAIADFDARKPWTAGPLTKDGHAVYAVGYDHTKGVTVLTWGNTQEATWAWWDECVDEAYAILPPEAKDKKFAGFDITQLQVDLESVTN